MFLWSARLKTSITSFQRPVLFRCRRAHQTETTDAARQAVIDQLETVLRLNPITPAPRSCWGWSTRGAELVRSHGTPGTTISDPTREPVPSWFVCSCSWRADIGTARATRWLDRVLDSSRTADARQTKNPFIRFVDTSKRASHPRAHRSHGASGRGDTAPLAIRPPRLPNVGAGTVEPYCVHSRCEGHIRHPDPSFPLLPHRPRRRRPWANHRPPGEQTARHPNPPPNPLPFPPRRPSESSPHSAGPEGTSFARPEPRRPSPHPNTSADADQPRMPSYRGAGRPLKQARCLKHKRSLTPQYAAVPETPTPITALHTPPRSWASWTLLRPITARRFAMPHREVSCTGTYRPGCCSSSSTATDG